MKKINLNLLETFFAVYKLRSYTKAAAYLECTASNVRQKMQRLEAITGMTYFVKKNKAFVPTKEAETLHAKAYKHFHSLELEVNCMDADKSSQHLEVLTSTGATMLWTISVIDEFKKSNEGMTFGIHTTEDSSIRPEANYDVVVLPQHFDHRDYVKMTAGTFSTMLYASKEYLEKYGIPESPEDLDQHQLVSFYHKSDSYRGDTDWSLRIGRPLSDPRSPALIVNNMLGISYAVASGMGISGLTVNNPFIKSHNLVRVLPDFAGPPVTFFLYYNTALGNNPFIKHLRSLDVEDPRSFRQHAAA